MACRKFPAYEYLTGFSGYQDFVPSIKNKKNPPTVGSLPGSYDPDK